MNAPQPIDPRKVRQHDNDITELYGLIDALRMDMNNGFTALNTKVDEGFTEITRLLQQALGGSGTT
jgi:hypothetical protein